MFPQAHTLLTWMLSFSSFEKPQFPKKLSTSDSAISSLLFFTPTHSKQVFAPLKLFLLKYPMISIYISKSNTPSWFLPILIFQWPLTLLTTSSFKHTHTYILLSVITAQTLAFPSSSLAALFRSLCGLFCYPFPKLQSLPAVPPRLHDHLSPHTSRSGLTYIHGFSKSHL